MLPERGGVWALLWSPEGREMCCKWMKDTHGGEARGGMLVGLSLPMPSTQDTWNMQNADQRTPGKDGGRGTGKNELSNSKRGSEMLCWGCGRVTSVVVLSLVHDRHCSNTKQEVNPIIWAT